MARGQPDYGAYQRKSTGATLADMGDLAVRLGSIVEYDRRGDIVALDNFEGTVLKWNTPVIGVGTVALDATVMKSGSQAVKLHTDVAGDATSDLVKYFTALGVMRLGAEISFSDLTDGSDIFFGLSYWNGTSGYRAQLWFQHSSANLYAEGPVSGVWTLVANVGLIRTGETLWYPMKLVVDFVNHFYLRVLFSGAEYPIPTLALPTYGSVGGVYILSLFRLQNVVATNHNVWVDDFILTQNEP